MSGEAFPGEPTLARQLAVGRQSIREGLIRLEIEGLISRRRGAETVVNTRAVGIRARFDRRVNFVELLSHGGSEPGTEVLGAERIGLGADDAHRLDRPEGSPAWQVSRRWMADGETLVATIDVLPLPDGIDDPSPGLALVDAVAAVTGTGAEWEMVRPDAVAADGRTAPMCGVDVGVPLLTLDLVGVSRSGRLLYHSREMYRPGTFDYEFIRVLGH